MWNARPGALFKKPSLLVMDTAPAHMSDKVKQKLKNGGTTVKFIPGGMTPLLQPLDTHLNRPMKDFMTAKWNEWLESGEQVT